MTEEELAELESLQQQMNTLLEIRESAAQATRVSGTQAEKALRMLAYEVAAAQHIVARRRYEAALKEFTTTEQET